MNRLGWTALLVLLAPIKSSVSAAEPDKSKLDPAVLKQASESIDRGLEFLRKTQQEDGSFAPGEFGSPITGLAIASALRIGHVTTSDPMIAKGLSYLEKHIQSDGGIYPKDARQATYSTAICVMAFVEANKDKKYQPVIDKAVAFLKTTQWDESDSIDEKDPKFGGVGYGGKQKSRPDLSNTAFMLEALSASGIPHDDPAFQRAKLFITRCQNFSEEGGNDLPVGKLINDGGFFYTPVPGRESEGKAAPQPLRSYGTMTYAGLKSFIYAGVKKDDPRVQAALSWIKKNYSVSENPGMGEEGLFYYYHTFSKTLSVLGAGEIEDQSGAKHDWRSELIKTLAAKQRPDGSWVNANRRWFENDPALVTSYSLMALALATN